MFFPGIGIHNTPGPSSRPWALCSFRRLAVARPCTFPRGSQGSPRELAAARSFLCCQQIRCAKFSTCSRNEVSRDCTNAFKTKRSGLGTAETYNRGNPSAGRTVGARREPAGTTSITGNHDYNVLRSVWFSRAVTIFPPAGCLATHVAGILKPIHFSYATPSFVSYYNYNNFVTIHNAFDYIIDRAVFSRGK